MAASFVRRCLLPLALVLAALLGACSSIQYQVNAPLDAYAPQQGYRLGTLQTVQGTDERIFMVVLFSGGGARAAALGYGVLEELARYRFAAQGASKRLFDEISVVYSVSGGSMLAAYYGLKGDGIFADFERRFLDQNLQDKITGSIVSVANLWRLTSPRFGRSDLVQEQLDNALFQGATFDDLLHRRKGPFVVISATDMSSGGRFDFTQDFFDLICSDLGKFPIARAVAASSAVPLVFSPITLWNYAGSCGYQPSGALLAASMRQSRGPRAQAARSLSQELLGYLERDQRRYVHLLDGGLSDNLSIRGILDMATLIDSDTLKQRLHLEKTTEYVVVLVNAQNDITHTIDQSADVPGLAEVVRAVSDIPINRYTEESELQMESAIERWRAAAESEAQKRHNAPPSFYYINVGLKNLSDEAERDTLLNVPTTLYLPRASVQHLKRAAASLLNDSMDFRRLVDDLAATREAGAPDSRPAPVAPPAAGGATMPGD